MCDETYGNLWGESDNPRHSVDEWKLDVSHDNTRAGYWEWVRSREEAEEHDE